MAIIKGPREGGARSEGRTPRRTYSARHKGYQRQAFIQSIV